MVGVFTFSTTHKKHFRIFSEQNWKSSKTHFLQQVVTKYHFDFDKQPGTIKHQSNSFALLNELETNLYSNLNEPCHWLSIELPNLLGENLFHPYAEDVQNNREFYIFRKKYFENQRYLWKNMLIYHNCMESTSYIWHTNHTHLISSIVTIWCEIHEFCIFSTFSSFQLVSFSIFV